MVGAGRWSEFLGVDSVWVVVGVGVALVTFSAALLRNSSRESIDRREAWAAAFLDAVWVTGSVWLLVFAPDLLGAAGRWAVLAVADVVAVFAVLQAYALWRTRGGDLPQSSGHGG